MPHATTGAAIRTTVARKFLTCSNQEKMIWSQNHPQLTTGLVSAADLDLSVRTKR